MWPFWATLKQWSRAWDGKASYCELWCGRWRVSGLKKYLLGVKTTRREHNWCWFLTRQQKICFEGQRPYLPFKTARLHPGSWINRLCQQSLHVMIYVEKARVIERERERVRWWYFALIKCGNIVSGWLWIVLSVPRTWLIVWFPEVVDRQNSPAGISWCSCKNIVYKHENASWVFSWSDFVQDNRFWARER